MNKNRFPFLGPLLLLAALLASNAFKAFYYLLIEPVAYYWWGIKQVIQTIPQSVYWFFLVASLGIFSLISLLHRLILFKEDKDNNIPRKGAVESLAHQISRSYKQRFFKWVVANRLANIQLNILDYNQEGTGDLQSGLSKLNQSPSPKIMGFLDTGLNSSFMDYQHDSKRSTSPLNIDLLEVIEYLESQMEIKSD